MIRYTDSVLNRNQQNNAFFTTTVHSLHLKLTSLKYKVKIHLAKILNVSTIKKTSLLWKEGVCLLVFISAVSRSRTVQRQINTHVT